MAVEKVAYTIQNLETGKIRIRGVWFLGENDSILDNYIRACHNSGNRYMGIPTINPVTHRLTVIREHEAKAKLSESHYRMFVEARPLSK